MYKSQLFSISNRMRSGKVSSPKASQRVVKAAFSILQHGFFKYMYENNHFVYVSRRTGELGCTCKDFKYRRAPNRAFDGECKHIMAARIHIRAIAADVGVFNIEIKDGIVYYNWERPSHHDDILTGFISLPFQDAMKMTVSSLDTVINTTMIETELLIYDF